MAKDTFGNLYKLFWSKNETSGSRWQISNSGDIIVNTHTREWKEIGSR